jgi:hypothetical protein
MYGTDFEDALRSFREDAVAVGIKGGVFFRNVREG